ncbi:trypsin-like serine protease [Gordonia sp. DT219]|uniref:trypsin-like serine protease n=1 Tax=Gordonia sp. DT219 TaxID=3416658 RepID=UPI003CF17138
MRIKLLAALVLGAVGLVAAPVATAQAAVPTVRSGMAINVDETIVTSTSCTLGAVVSPSKALTAGHCGHVGQVVYTDQGDVIGKITANQITRGLDIAVISLAPHTRAQLDSVAWGAAITKGERVTKMGVTSGFSAGTIADPKPTMRTAYGYSFAPPFLLQNSTVSVRAVLFSREGDSGSGIRDAGGNVVGILSAGASDNDTLVAPVSLLPAGLR